MDRQHAAVWVDHQEARIIKFGLSDDESYVVRSKAPTVQVHHKANSIGDGRAPIDKQFYEEVAAALIGMPAIPVTGPGAAKMELASHIREKRPNLGKAIEGIEPLDHPTEGELLKFARKYLRAADRIHE